MSWAIPAIALAGYAYSQGDILLDASAPVEDAELVSNSLVLAWARALRLGGDGGKIDVVFPYAWASGTGKFRGQPHRRDVDGFGDPTIRFTWNFVGAPALTLPEYRDYRPDWIVGASVRVALPLGQYDADKLLNIGLNRWSFKPELGISKTWQRWTYELVTGVTFYTDNDEFFVDSTREQDPLYSVQGQATLGPYNHL